jgi:hypothetical protein
MGLSGPIRNIAASGQHVTHVCEDCVHADRFVLEPRAICTDAKGPHSGRALYAWQAACERHVPMTCRDLTLHLYP